MQVHVWPDLLRFGVEHWRVTWQRLRQHVHIWSRGDPGLHRLHILDELEANGSPVVRRPWSNRRRSLQLICIPLIIFSQ